MIRFTMLNALKNDEFYAQCADEQERMQGRTRGEGILSTLHKGRATREV